MVFVKWLNGGIGVRPLLLKIPKFRLISWCKNFVELHGRFLRNSAWNCAFPQNRHTRKLGEITVFYAVLVFSQKNLPLWCEQNLNWHRTFDWSCPAVITTKSWPTQYFYSLWRILALQCLDFLIWRRLHSFTRCYIIHSQIYLNS